MNIRNLTLKQMLVLGMVLSGTLPLLINAVVNLQCAVSTIEMTEMSHLESVRQVKKNQIEDYFKQIHNQVQTMAENIMIVEAAKEFRGLFTDYRTN